MPTITFFSSLASPHPFVRSGYHPFVPTCAQRVAIARNGGQGWPRLRATALAARSVLEGREHEATFGRVGNY